MFADLHHSDNILEPTHLIPLQFFSAAFFVLIGISSALLDVSGNLHLHVLAFCIHSLAAFIGCLFAFQPSGGSHKICLRHIFASHNAAAVIHSLVIAYNRFGRLWFETVVLWRMSACIMRIKS